MNSGRSRALPSLPHPEPQTHISSRARQRSKASFRRTCQGVACRRPLRWVMPACRFGRRLGNHDPRASCDPGSNRNERRGSRRAAEDWCRDRRHPLRVSPVQRDRRRSCPAPHAADYRKPHRPSLGAGLRCPGCPVAPPGSRHSSREASRIRHRAACRRGSSIRRARTRASARLHAR